MKIIEKNLFEQNKRLQMLLLEEQRKTAALMEENRRLKSRLSKCGVSLEQVAKEDTFVG